MTVNLKSPVLGSDPGAEVVDGAQFRNRVNMLADIYDRLHGNYERLQADLDAQKLNNSSTIDRYVKAPSRSCIIALGEETETKAHAESHGFASEQLSLADVQGAIDSIPNSENVHSPAVNLKAGEIDADTPISQANFTRKYGKETLELGRKPERHHALSHTFMNEIQSLRHVRKRAPATRRQKFFEKLLDSTTYDVVMACTIIFNTVLLILETDRNAGCHAEDANCIPAWITQINIILLSIYTMEMFIVLDVHRCGIWLHPARLIEAFIVFFGFADLILTYAFNSAALNMQALKMVRLLRLVRGVRIISIFPELHHIVVGFAGAMRTMFWGFVTLMFLMLIMSLVAVELFSPLNKNIDQDNEYCQEVFDTVWNAVVLFFQTLAAGDSWGACTLPIIKRFPISFVFFAATLISVQVGFMNLIMSVTMDRVSEARDKNMQARVVEKQRSIIATRTKWLHLFDQLDKDGSGDLSLEELVDGFDSLPNFNIDLQLLGIERDDLPNLLSIMDQDGNSVVSVDELLFVFDMVTHFDSKMFQITASMQSKLIGQRLESMLTNLQRMVSEFVQFSKPSAS